MESGSDTEEFYDAAEELSPVKRRSNTQREKEKANKELQGNDAVDGKGKEKHEEPEPQINRKEGHTSVVLSHDRKMSGVYGESLPEASITKEMEDNSPEQNLKTGKEEATEFAKAATQELKSSMDGTKKEGGKEKDSTESPAPVAPPRRKRRQKKDSTSKEIDLPVKAETTEKQKPPPRPPAPHETEGSSSRPPSLVGPPGEQPPKNTSAKPARPPRPPPLRPQTSSDSAPERPTEPPLEPRVRMNTDSRDMTQDMTRVLERGSSLDIVYNTDSAETKGTDSGERGKEHLPERDPPSLPSTSNLVRSNSISGRPLSDIEILQQVEVKNLDTGETIPLSVAEEKLPQCTNPMALHLMRLTSEYSSNPSLSQVVEDGHLSDSSTTPSVKVENKRKKLKRFFGKTVQKIRSVADEVKSRRGEESSSSDDEEAQENTYIKFKSHRAVRDRIAFDKIRLLQDLGGEHMGAVWTMKFSTCGRLLATAGQDNIVRIWVLKDAQPYFEDMRAKYSKSERSPSPTSSIASIASATSGEDDQSAEGSAETREDDTEDLGPFRRSPFCSYHGHTSDVLDLSWSKNYFILSSSMDKTVRLWHISRHECLCCFQHVDFVTAICFHPRDDRYFLSGSLDGKIRLWNIPEKKVALWNEIDGSRTSLITAANFCQNGKLAVVGTYDGRCIFYDTERLKYHTQLTVRSTRGKNARGRKISGIEPLPGEDKVLVTSNDSRIRLYDLKDHSLYCKYKGGQNSSSQIKAMFSHDGQYIISGSEDHFVYIWRTYHDVQNVRKDRNEYYESFSAHDAVVTAGIFAPVPSVIVPPSDGFERVDSELTYRSEIIVTADWSGGIKLFVNR